MHWYDLSKSDTELENPIRISPYDYVDNTYSFASGKQLGEFLIPFISLHRPIEIDIRREETPIELAKFRHNKNFYEGLKSILLVYWDTFDIENNLRFIDEGILHQVSYDILRRGDGDYFPEIEFEDYDF